MSKQQLYINGKAVDMPSSEIKIKVESNIFNDAGSIMTAHSYSLTLPRTMTNDSIMHNAYVPAADTANKSTHRYLRASLYIDGVPMFEKGQAVVNKVDDKGYSINLYWGLLGIFETIKDEGLNVCDIPASAYWSESRARWRYLEQYDAQLPQYISGMTQDIYNTLDTESKELADISPWLLPSVQVRTVLNDIMNTYGLTLQLSTEANIRINRLWHPLTSRKAVADGEKVTINGVVQMHQMATNKWVPTFLPTQIDPQHFPNIQWAVLALPDHPPTLNHSATNGNIANDCTAIGIGNQYERVGYMDANCDIKVTRVRIFGALPYPSIIYIPALNDRRIAPTYDSGSNPPQTYDIDIKESFSVSSGEEILRLADEWQDPDPSFSAGVLNIQLTIDEADGVRNQRPYDLVRNYPNVGIVDYLSEILAHIGGCIVGSVSTPNTLRIYTIDEIAQKEPIALDTYGVKSITMGIDNTAQKNVYMHTENDDANTHDKAEGVIYTNDTTLPKERTAFDSKFKVPVLGIVKLWDVDKEEHKASWNNAGDYIASEFNGSIINNGQDFANTIADYYTNYAKWIEHPKIVEAIVKMSVLELMEFDFTRPIYIKQLSRSYVVKSLDSEGGDNYKLTMLQI